MDCSFAQLLLRAQANRKLLRTAFRVACDHAQARRECLETSSLVATSKSERSVANLEAGATVRFVSVATILVVDEQTAICDGLEQFGLRVLEVELWEPVVRKVLGIAVNILWAVFGADDIPVQQGSSYSLMHGDYRSCRWG